MKGALEGGQFVHVVATIDKGAGTAVIRYVNPATSRLATNAARDQDVELVGIDGAGQEVYREAVVVRQSSDDPSHPNRIGLIQADVPSVPGLRSLSLRLKDIELSRYDAGRLEAPAGGASLGLAPPELSTSPNKRTMTIQGLSELLPVAGVTWTVLVRPENSAIWTTIALSRPVPLVTLDRNQFPGARRATIKVLRTTGMAEETVVEETIDLFTAGGDQPG